MDYQNAGNRDWLVSAVSIDILIRADDSIPSLLLMNFFMNLTVYTQNVYEPYATSHFKAHSLLVTGSIVAGIVRIVSYPLLAKLANVRTS
jgi:hypothetical protein